MWVESKWICENTVYNYKYLCTIGGGGPIPWCITVENIRVILPALSLQSKGGVALIFNFKQSMICTATH